MKKQLTSSDLVLLIGADQRSGCPLFEDYEGNPIYAGDTVQFQIDYIFPSIGIATNDMRIETYNIVLDKVEYYQIIKDLEPA